MREEGIVISYNGYEGEIKGQERTYSLLREEVCREDQADIDVGSIVKFTPKENVSSVGSFWIAKEIKIYREKAQDNAPITIFKKRTLRKSIRK
jgi:hypothetical protein